MPAYIEVKDSKGQRQVSLDEGPVTIGRNFTNLLVLDETQASRFHCVIEKSPEGYSIRDLDSRNGFRVNGSPVRAAILYDGDVVSIGKTDMRLYLPNSKKNPSGGMGGGGADDPFQELADLVSGATTPSLPGEPTRADESDALNEDLPEPPPSQPVASANEYERLLRERVEALADRSFGEKDITLINARGKSALASEKDTGEAVVIFRLMLLLCFRSRATDMHVEPRRRTCRFAFAWTGRWWTSCE